MILKIAVCLSDLNFLMSLKNNSNTDLGSKVFISASWLVAGTWGSRLLGIISTIILARILFPDDYGVVAKAMLVVQFVEIVSVLGGERYLIAKQDADDNDFNTAWTLRLIQCALIALFLFLLAGVFGDFLNEPRLEYVIQVFSIAVLFSGLQNIGLEKYKKELQFQKIFVFNLGQKLFSFIITIALAFILQSYWAMIIGAISFRLIGVILSYIMHPFRPRLTLSKVKQQWGFTKWTLVNNLASFLKNKLDILIVGRYFDSTNTGLFYMSHHISNMPTTELVIPIYQALYSGYAKLSHDLVALAQAHLNALNAVSVIIFPIVSGIYILSNDFVILLLGDRWGGAVELIEILVLVACVIGINGLSTNILISLRLVKHSARIDWLYVIILIPALLFAISYESLLVIAWARLLVTLLMFPFYLNIVRKKLPVSWMDFWGSLWRPLFSAGAVVLVLWFWQTGVQVEKPQWIPFLSKIVVAGTLYISILYGLWVVSGRQYTGEKILYDKLIQAVKKRL